MEKKEVNITVGLRPEVKDALSAQAEANGRADKREAEKLIEQGLGLAASPQGCGSRGSGRGSRN